MTNHIITLRLRWYVHSTAQLLRRRWQTLFLFAGLFSFAVLMVSSELVLTLLDESNGMLWRFCVISLWQASWVLWVLMQLDQVRGGAFREFAQSLPLSFVQWRTADLTVLLVADTPLLIPFAAAAVVLGMEQGMSWESLNGIVLIAFLLSTQLACQLAVLGRSNSPFHVIIVANVWVAFALSLNEPKLSAVMLLIALLGGLGLLVGKAPALPVIANTKIRLWQQMSMRFWQRILAKLPPVQRISLDIVYVQHRASVLGKFLFCMLVVALSATLLSQWQYDNRSLPMVQIAAGLIALSTSGLYRQLQMAHDNARPFTQALPLPPRWALTSDTVAVLSIGLPFVLLLSITAWMHIELSVLKTIGVVVSYVVLVILLRVPQLYSLRHSVLSSLCVAGLWLFAALLWL